MQRWGGGKFLPRPYRAASFPFLGVYHGSGSSQLLLAVLNRKKRRETRLGRGVPIPLVSQFPLQKIARGGGFCWTSGNRNLAEMPLFLPFDHAPQPHVAKVWRFFRVMQVSLGCPPVLFFSFPGVGSICGVGSFCGDGSFRDVGSFAVTALSVYKTQCQLCGGVSDYCGVGSVDFPLLF